MPITDDSQPASPDEQIQSQPTGQSWFVWWSKWIPPHIVHIFLPRDAHEQLLPGEELLLEVHLAWYRNIVAKLFIQYWVGLIAVTTAASVLSGVVAYANQWDILMFTAAPPLMLLLLALYALYERFTYMQWRLVKTNKRIILTKPMHDSWYMVDTIDISNKPQVIDVNWSDNQTRRMMQQLTGARDVYISLSGLQFSEGTAKVKDAIIMPDVLAKDVDTLRKLVFG